MNVEIDSEDKNPKNYEESDSKNEIKLIINRLSPLILLGIWLCFIIFPKLFEILLLSLFKDTSIQIIIQNNNWVQIIIRIITFLLNSLIIFYLFKRKNMNIIKELGLNTPKVENVKKFFVGALWGMIIIILREIASVIIGERSIYYNINGLFELVIYSLFYAVVFAVSEEIIYRGFFQNQLKKGMHQSLAIILIAFSSFLTIYDFSYDYEILETITSSIIFGYLYATSKNLYLTIGWQFMTLFIIKLGNGILNYTPYSLSYVAIIQCVANAIIFLGIIINQFYNLKKHNKRVYQ